MRHLLKYKIFENVQQAKSILKDLKISEDDNDYQLIRQRFKGSEGYVGWFTKMRYKNNIPIDELTDIIDLIDTNSPVIKFLPKSLIEYDKFEDLLDDIEITKSKIEVKRCYDEFPSIQKNLIDLEDPKVVELLKSLSSLKNKSAYFAKVARYKNKSMLIDSIKSFVEGNSKSDGFDDIVRSIKSRGSYGLKIITQDKEHDIIIIRAIDPNVVSSLGSGTSWCIRNSSTFRSYVPDENTHQYMIWLTDMPTYNNYSIIGVTIGPKGYVTGHLKDDSHININQLAEVLLQRNVDFKKLYPNLKKSYDYSILELRLIFNMTNDEILDNKKLTYNDFHLFTRQDFDKRGITGQFILPLEALIKMGYSKDEIFKHKTKFHDVDLKHLTRDEIRKIGFDKFQLSNIMTLFGPEEIFKNKKAVNDNDEFYIIGVDNILKFNMSLDDVTLSNMAPWIAPVPHHYHTNKNTKYLPIEYILSHKNKWSVSDLYYFSKKEVIDLINKFKVTGGLSSKFKNNEFFTREEVIELKNKIIFPIDIRLLGEISITIDDCKKYDIKVAYGGFPSEKPKNLVFVDHDGKTKSEWSPCLDFYKKLSGKQGYGDTGNQLQVFNLLKFYNLSLHENIAILGNIELSSYGDPKIVDVIGYLMTKGLDISNDNIIKIVESMSGNSYKHKNIVEVVTHFKLDRFYDDIIKIVNTSDDISVSKLDSLPDSYKSKVDEVKNYRKVKDITKNRAMTPWYSGMGAQKGKSHDSSLSYMISEKELDAIYEIFKEAKQTHWINDTWHRVDGPILVFFFALAKLNKLDEFKELDYQFNDKTLFKLLGHLCNSSRANSRNCVGIDLTKEEELRAYNWLKANYFRDYELFPLDEQAPITYKFDKPRFEKLFKMLLEMKAEYPHHISSTKSRESRTDYKDIKMYNFRKLIGYFMSSKDFTDEEAGRQLIAILDRFFSSIKLTNKGLKETLNILGDYSFSYLDNRRKILRNYLEEKFPIIAK